MSLTICQLCNNTHGKIVWCETPTKFKWREVIGGEEGMILTSVCTQVWCTVYRTVRRTDGRQHVDVVTTSRPAVQFDRLPWLRLKLQLQRREETRTGRGNDWITTATYGVVPMQCNDWLRLAPGYYCSPSITVRGKQSYSSGVWALMLYRSPHIRLGLVVSWVRN